jgi:hypothetical protein
LINGLAGPELRAAIDRGTLNGFEAFLPKQEGEIMKTVPRKSGEFADSWLVSKASVRVRPTAKGATLHYGSKHKAAFILEEGGDILPKKAKHLAVPVRPEAIGKKPREVDGLTPIRLASGDLYLGLRSVFGLELWYKLVDKVTLTGSHYLAEAAKQAGGHLVDTMDRALDVEMGKIGNQKV